MVPVNNRFRSAPGGTKLAFLLLLTLALAPVLLVSLPAAMVDYPNHLARMFVLARAGTAQAHPLYEVNWSFAPNLAMDLIVPPIGLFIGVEAATRSFYLLSQVLVVTGAVAIERVVKGRHHISGFVALMFLWSIPFAFGFVNFEFSLGCVLWGISWALRLQERQWILRFAAHSTVLVGLSIAHLFACGLYGFTIGLHELWRALSRQAGVLVLLARLTPLATPAIVVFTVFLGFGSHTSGAGNEWFFSAKLFWLIHIMNGYSFIASSVGMSLLAVLSWGIIKKHAMRTLQSGTYIFIGFTALYVVMPFKLFDTAFVDFRVLVAAALILPGFVSVEFPSPTWARRAFATASGIVVLNVAVVLSVWISYQADYRAARESFNRIAPGAMVLIADSAAGLDPPLFNLSSYPIYHVPALAVGYADAFVPTLFTQPGKQPVTPRPALQRLDLPYGGPVPISLLESIARNGPGPDTRPFVRNWTKDYDYVYIVGRHVSNPMADILVEMSSGPRFTLYRIKEPLSHSSRRL